MKHNSIKKTLYATVAISALSINMLSTQKVTAETITYDGTPADSSKLQADPLLISNSNQSLLPSLTGSQSNNRIEVSGNSSGAYIAPYNVYGGIGVGTGDVTVSDNSVTVSEGSIGGFIYGGNGVADTLSLTGSNGDVTVNNNNVTVSGGSIGGSVYGGYSASYSYRWQFRDSYGTGAMTANDNVVMVSDGSITGSVYGADINSGKNYITLKNNAVTISGGRIGGSVYGGSSSGNVLMLFSMSDEPTFDPNDVGNVAVEINNNTVTISNGRIGGSVYGGYNRSYTTSGGGSTGDIKVTNNTVSLYGGSITGALYGGYSTFDEVVITDFDKVVAGNTLNIAGFSGSVAGIYNFENYNWVLPKTAVNNEPIIQITGDDAVNLNRTNHTIAVVNDGTRMKVNDTIVMIDKANGDPASVPAKVPDEIRQGHFLTYDVDVKVDEDGKFILKVLGVDGEDGGRINSNSKALLEGRAAALGFVSQGSDLIATAGIDYIRMMAGKSDKELNGLPLIPFMIMQGASNRYKTGSHADVDGFNMATGLATGGEFGQGNKVTLGAFFEYGRGTYDTYNNFNSGYVHGNGDVNYTGGGIFGRLDFAGTGLGRVANLTPTQADGLYLEASLRAGRVSMGFDSDDLNDPEGLRGNYDSKTGYLGGHASAGYVFNFDEQNALDVYARYLWTRMNGDTVSVGKDTLHFDKSTSSRMQLGGRYSYDYSAQFKPYLGAAYEYEFAGDIGATAYGLRLDEPSLKGSTGIVEAGFTFVPDIKTPAFSINLNAQAFFGQRQGGSGQVKIKYQF